MSRALRDPEVHKAITSGPHGRIAVTYMEWAGPPTQQVVIPGPSIDGPAAARAFADRLEAAPISRARMTSISAALQFSERPVRHQRRQGHPPRHRRLGRRPQQRRRAGGPVRDELVAKGIVINGLPIMLKLAVGLLRSRRISTATTPTA